MERRYGNGSSGQNRSGSTRRRRPAAQPESAADLIGQLVSRLGGDGRAVEQRVFQSYTRVVGGLIGRRSRPDALRGTTLYVRVESSALAHELTLLKRQILAQMAPELPEGSVTDLRTKIGPLTPE